MYFWLLAYLQHHSTVPLLAVIAILSIVVISFNEMSFFVVIVNSFNFKMLSNIMWIMHSPLILLWLRTSITVHAQTAAQQQSK